MQFLHGTSFIPEVNCKNCSCSLQETENMAYFSFVLFGNNMVTACVESIKRSIQFSVSARPLQEV